MGGAKKDPNAPKRPLSAYFIFMGMCSEVINLCNRTVFFRWKESRGQSCQLGLQDGRHRQGDLSILGHSMDWIVPCRLRGKCGKNWMRRRRLPMKRRRRLQRRNMPRRWPLIWLERSFHSTQTSSECFVCSFQPLNVWPSLWICCYLRCPSWTCQLHIVPDVGQT